MVSFAYSQTYFIHPKDGQSGAGIPLDDGPVYTAGTAVSGQQGRMIADGSNGGNIQKGLGYDIGDECKDDQIGT